MDQLLVQVGVVSERDKLHKHNNQEKIVERRDLLSCKMTISTVHTQCDKKLCT